MRKWFLAITLALVALVVSNSCVPIDTSRSPEPSEPPQGSVVTPSPPSTETTQPGVTESPIFSPQTTIFNSDSSDKIEKANLSTDEIKFLGKSIHKVVSDKLLEETDLNHRRQLFAVDDLAKRIASAKDSDTEDIIRVDPDSSEGQTFVNSLAEDVSKYLVEWALMTGLITSPPVLIALVFAYAAVIGTETLAEELSPKIASRLIMKNVGLLTLRNFTGSETVSMELVYDRKTGETMANVYVYPMIISSPGSKVPNIPSETIFMLIPFKRVIWNENAGSTAAVFPEYGGDEIDGGRVRVIFKSTIAKTTNVTLTLYVHENSASGPIISGAMVAGQDGAGVSFSKTTDSNGLVTITGAPGTWSFTASKSGYDTNSWQQSITATDAKHAYLMKQVSNVTLTLYVHENSASGPIISGATVTGQDGAGASFSQVTNSNGVVTITGAPGNWGFTASKSGYDTNSWQQSITATDTKHAYLVKQVVAPQVTGVNPSQPKVQATRQWISILGSGFVSESQVTLRIAGSTYVIPTDRTQFISSGQVNVYVGLTEAGTWSAQVSNPGGQQSNIYNFQVVP